MPTSSYYKYNVFVADIANKVHNLGSDQIRVALTPTAPTVTDTTVVGEIVYDNISGTASTYLTTVSSSQLSGTYSFICNDLTLTAIGVVPDFRYVIIKNHTANKNIGWYDYGSLLSLSTGDSLKVDLDNVNGILQIT